MLVGKKYCSSLVCSLASEFTNQKFSKTSTFSCPLISHSVILLIPPFPIYLLPNIGVRFAPKIFVRTCTKFVYILLLSCCCSKHTGSLGAHMPACMWAPRKSSSKELDPVLYIVGSQWRNVREASGDTFYMSSTLIKGMPFILWHPISLYWEWTLYWDTRTSDSQLLSAV